VNEEALAHWRKKKKKKATVTALIVIWILKKTIKRKTKTYVGCGGRALLIFIH
jgi:TM2 domain-containing membrane protein YozV